MDDDRFRDFLQEFSNAYPGDEVRELRFLLHDNLSISVLSNKHYLGMDLFTELRQKGLIAYNDVNIMSEIADLTENTAAKDSVMRYKQDVDEYYDGFGPYWANLKEKRKQLYKAMCSITENKRGDFDKLIAFYELRSYGFKNKWDLVFYLERELKLDTQMKLDIFANQLNEGAKTILLDTGGQQVDIVENLSRTAIKKTVALDVAIVIALIAVVIALIAVVIAFIAARPIGDPPNAPTVTLLEQNLNSITLRIEDPEYTGGLDLVAYNISFRYKSERQYVGDFEMFDYKNKNEKDFQMYTIKELSSAKLYNIRVAGKNKYMLGDQSEELDARTLTEDEIIRNFLTAEQKRKFHNPNIKPPTWNSHFENEYNISLMFTDPKLIPKILKKDKYPHLKICNHTSFEKLLGIIKSMDSCKVCMTGEGGVGKTTLLQYISYNWATDSHSTFTGKILFLINIRDIKAGQTITDMIVDEVPLNIFSKNTSFPENKTIIKMFIEKYDRELIVLLDGLDELEDGVVGPDKLLEGTELRESIAIITSRPGFTVKLLKKHCDLYVKVQGFTEKNIKQFINKYFKLIRNHTLGESLIEELKLNSEFEEDWGGDYKTIFELLPFPYFLLKMCTIWEHEQKVPNNLQDLFKEIFRCILNQYINRRGTTKAIETLDHIPPEFKHSILILGNISYTILQKNVLHFTKLKLRELVKNETLVDLSLKLGFVYIDNPIVQDRFLDTYRYPHKLLAEALAGFYLSHKYQFETLDFKESEELRTNNYLHMTTAFTISFLGLDADKIMKHWLVNNASNYYSFSKFFQYVNQDHNERLLESLDKHMSAEMKVQVERFRNSLKIIYTHNNSHCIQLLQLLYKELTEYPKNVTRKVNVLINESTKKSSETVCRLVAHLLIIMQLHAPEDTVCYEKMCDLYLLMLVEKWGDTAIKIISKEWRRYHLKEKIHLPKLPTYGWLNITNFYFNKKEYRQCRIDQIHRGEEDDYVVSKKKILEIRDQPPKCKNSKMFLKLNYFNRELLGNIINFYPLEGFYLLMYCTFSDTLLNTLKIYDANYLQSKYIVIQLNNLSDIDAHVGLRKLIPCAL
ncbi:uncharacterized protein [Antedon mediterranea]|uniref:uncharacterized protein n=1 Tax=Antedon mediterranea TaxID=105859 RepID=UPI003AF8BE7E